MNYVKTTHTKRFPQLTTLQIIDEPELTLQPVCVCFLILKLRIRMPLRAADIKRSVCVCKYTCSPCSYSQQSVVSRH